MLYIDLIYPVYPINGDFQRNFEIGVIARYQYVVLLSDVMNNISTLLEFPTRNKAIQQRQ